MRSGSIIGIRLFSLALAVTGALFMHQSSPLMAQDEPAPEIDLYDNQSVGICHKQPEMTERELKRALEVMRTIVDKKGVLSPEEEENLIRGRELGSDRLNCLMGKLMAANDIFGWGRAEDYGVPLTAKEKKFSAKYAKDSLMLKQYLEEVLNVRVE